MITYPLIDLDSKELTDKDNNKHRLHPHEFWYMAPKGGILLHNAFCGKGLVLAMDDLLKGIPIKPNKRTSETNKVEEIFEEIRLNSFPNLPSRLRCHFLSISKEVAETRLKEWEWKNKRILTKCYLILSSGKYHLANIDKYEEAVRRGDKNLVKQLASEYWEKGFLEANYLDKRIELLADSCLYFTEWESFSKIELGSVVNKNLEVFSENGWKRCNEIQ